MPKRIASTLLLLNMFLLPLAASANCGFAQDEYGNMTIVVGKKSNTCFNSEGFREAFKAGVAQALDENDPIVAQKKAYDQRNARGQKLWAIAERNYQATSPSGRYFGQK